MSMTGLVLSKGAEFLDLLSIYHYFNAECRLINTVSGTNSNYTWLLTVENGLHTYLKRKKANICAIEQYLCKVGECEPCVYCEPS
jgi:hypothetical protein